MSDKAGDEADQLLQKQHAILGRMEELNRVCRRRDSDQLTEAERAEWDELSAEWLRVTQELSTERMLRELTK